LQGSRPGSFDLLSHAHLDRRNRKASQMPDREHRPFDAWLPRIAKSIRISTLHDAQVFARRWVIRDKNPELKILLRRMDRASGSDAAAIAMHDLREALGKRGLLSPAQTDGAGVAAAAPVDSRS
jgi:hypothetical protein